MTTDSANHGTWTPVRERTAHVRTILRHQARKRTETVLVAERHDGMWASTNLYLGATTGVQQLTLGTALSRNIKRLYEVDISPRKMLFSSIFETEAEGAVVEGDVAAIWKVADPVGLIMRPRFDHLNAIQKAAEDILRPIVHQVTVETVEKLADKADIALAPMLTLPQGVISWGDADTQFRLTGLGALHRHSVEAIRRAAIVDREQRDMDKERIQFYADVIQSGHVNLLAMMLSNNKSDVEKVLGYIERYEVPVGRAALSGDDPLRHAVNQMMNEADEFARQEMRLSLLETWRTHQAAEPLDRLRDALGQHSRDTPGTT